MGTVVQLPVYTPRVPRDHDTELSIHADLSLLQKIEKWVVAERTACVREAKPLTPSDRLMVMDALDALGL